MSCTSNTKQKRRQHKPKLIVLENSIKLSYRMHLGCQYSHAVRACKCCRYLHTQNNDQIVLYYPSSDHNQRADSFKEKDIYQRLLWLIVMVKGIMQMRMRIGGGGGEWCWWWRNWWNNFIIEILFCNTISSLRTSPTLFK